MVKTAVDYRQIVNETLGAFWMVEADTGVVADVNEAYCATTGYSEDEILGKKISDFEIWESAKDIAARLEMIKRDGECIFIATHRTKANLIVRFEVVSRPVSMDGRLYVCAFMKNISKTSEHDTHGAIVSTLYANHISGWRWDMMSDVMEWDNLTFDMLGCSDFAGKSNKTSWRSTVHPMDIERVDEELKNQLAEDDSFIIEFRVKKCDGSWLWVEGRGKILKYDKNKTPILSMGTYSDISHRKAMEDEIAEHQEKLKILNTQLVEMVKLETQKRIAKEVAFSSIFELFGTGLLILDSELRVIDANRQFLSLHDVAEKSEVIGRPYTDVLSESDRFDAQVRLNNVIASLHGKGCYGQFDDIDTLNNTVQYELAITTKNKNKKLNLLVSSTCFNGVNGLSNYIFSITDISTIRQLENKQKESEKLLIAQSRMAAMGEMMGAIAHQWRQPLNLLGILIQDVPYSFENGEATQEYADDFAKKAMEQVYFMSKTIDDFRNFFRSDKTLKEFYLLPHTQNSVALVMDMLKAHGIELTMSAIDNPVVSGYPNELSQAILNIVANAKDALDLLPNTARRHIAVTISKDSKYGTIEITDNAGGIPNDIIDRVFEPYFTTKPEGKGTGIGLYMSKAIVETNMGGVLSVQNNEEGAVFTIKVPLFQE